jgi:hypothetical protein
VLVGTLTVEESERLAAALRARGVACDVLNAKEDEHEARVVAAAGRARRRDDRHQHGRARHRIFVWATARRPAPSASRRSGGL